MCVQCAQYQKWKAGLPQGEASPPPAAVVASGDKAHVKPKMDAFEVQSKEAADEVNALWGLKMKGVLDTAQYQKAKAKVICRG